MKKKPPYNQEAVIRGALRRAFSRSPVVREILEESRQEFPRYKNDGTRHKRNWVKRQCQVCNEWVGSSKISVDHIIPVISIEFGKQDWNEFIDRLWCAKSNLQRICDPCHDAKTYEERILRLTKKYTGELDFMEMRFNNLESGRVGKLLLQAEVTIMLKDLKKYIAKKKSKGLEPIVARAIALRDRFSKYK